MIRNEPLLARSVETLRRVLRDIDEEDANRQAAIHVQWAIDLLDERYKIGQLATPDI